MDPSLGGEYVFGTCCRSVHLPNASQIQTDAFFGVSGNTSLFGGSRGRVFEVTGLFVGETLDDVFAVESALLSMDDGQIRTYIDTQGRSWDNVIFRSEYQPDPAGPRVTDWGWCLPFKAILIGLT